MGLCDALPAVASVELVEQHGGDGNVSLVELLVLAEFVKARRPCRIFEIGTFDGRTTMNLAANAPDDAKVFTLDLPKASARTTELSLDAGDHRYIDKECSGSRFSRSAHRDKIMQLIGDSATFDFDPFRNSVDFVFVDGSHSYEYVLNDSLRALEMVREDRGVIFWHDFDAWEGVTAAIAALYQKGGAFRMMRHIRETSLVVLDCGSPHAGS